MDRGQPLAVGQVPVHLLVELVVVQQPLQLHQHRVGLVGQLGHPGEDIFTWIAIDQHTGASVVSAADPSLDHRPYAPIGMNPAFGAPKLHR
jgi:hypothetical protein